MAVSKNHGAEKVNILLELGHRVFGENKVQEAVAKWTPLKEKYPDIELHMLGGMQSNKVTDACKVFDVIESVDRPRIAEAIAREKKRPEVFVQVNIGRENQKSGIDPAKADEFILYCKELDLNVTGVMCIPPVGVDPNPFFRETVEIAQRNNLFNISMGMSQDFELAMDLGATHVRVGTAIFGERI